MATGRLPGAQGSPLTTKGDLFGYTNTQARVPVGADGAVLQADSSASTGVSWAGPLFAAGKNKIINGDFGVWQRGTSFSTTTDMYTSDRFFVQRNNTNTISQQTFTPGTAPVAGYEGQYFLRYARTTVAGGTDFFYQRIEDVRTFAGQTVTFSFWAKANTAIAIGGVDVDQVFGSGGSGTVTVAGISSFSVTADWVRYSYTVALPSISGKTIGTGSHIRPRINFTGTAATFDTWGWQIEAGSTATAFQTATGTIQGELAACRYYYKRNSATSAYGIVLPTGSAVNTTIAVATFTDGPMRINPTSVDYATIYTDDGTGVVAITSVVMNASSSANVQTVNANVASGLTTYRPYRLAVNSSGAGYIGVSAEL